MGMKLTSVKTFEEEGMLPLVFKTKYLILPFTCMDKELKNFTLAIF